MNDVYTDLRVQLRNRFTDYLKADNVAYYPPALTVCPHCRAHCSIILDTIWSCLECHQNGDVEDYVMANNGFDSEEKAIRHLCRMLGIKNTYLEYQSADEIMDMQFSEPVFIAGSVKTENPAPEHRRGMGN